eukprot:TRINITY_DN809_c0_g1_i4.p1 TRINITY_DN809_c0_g1~~TRINITY_DN809_c0_g1_i4.p1  ORF type:complete len:573 (-),score=87.52 TRINITY_DN809_c0_g1_i4:68-1786(-)
MKVLDNIPISYLEQLLTNPLYREFPIEIQRQMWEVDEALLRFEVFPLFKAYIEDHGASTKNVYPHFVLQPYAVRRDSKAGLATEEGEGVVDAVWEGVQGEEGITSLLSFLAAHSSIPSPKYRRAKNSVLKKLLYFVGSSSSLYDKLQTAITDLYLNTNNPDFCTLYSELLFSLLESDSEVALSSTATSALCLRLNEMVSSPKDLSALTSLDAAMTRVFSTRTTTIVINPAPAATTPSGYKTRGSTARLEASKATETVIQSANPAEPNAGMLSGNTSVLVAMLVRDPYVTTALLSRIWSRLEFCVERDQMPRDDEFLPLLTRLLYISCHSRKIVSKKKYKEKTKATTAMIQQFYPLVILHMLDNEFNVPIDIKAHGGNFEVMFKREKMARKVSLFYCLHRAVHLDSNTTIKIIDLLASLKLAQIEEEGWFFSSLTRILASIASTLSAAVDTSEDLDPVIQNPSKSAFEQECLQFVTQIIGSLSSHFFGHASIHKDIVQVLLSSSEIHLPSTTVLSFAKGLVEKFELSSDQQTLATSKQFLKPTYLAFKDKLHLNQFASTDADAAYLLNWIDSL